MTYTIDVDIDSGQMYSHMACQHCYTNELGAFQLAPLFLSSIQVHPSFLHAQACRDVLNTNLFSELRNWVPSMLVHYDPEAFNLLHSQSLRQLHMP